MLEQILALIATAWPILVAIGVLIFDWGIIWQRIKTFITKEDMTEYITKVIDKELCREYDQRIKALDLQLSELRLWKEAHENWGMKQNEQNHLLLQEIIINLKRVCEAIDIKYLKQNGQKDVD